MSHSIGTRVRYSGTYSTPRGVVGTIVTGVDEYGAQGVHPDGAPEGVVQYAPAGDWEALDAATEDVALDVMAAATGGTVECLGGNIFGVLVPAVTVPGFGEAVMILAPLDEEYRFVNEWCVTVEVPTGRLAWGTGEDFVRFILPADLGATVATALSWLTSVACHRCHGSTEPGMPCEAFECRVCDGSPESGGCVDNHSPVMCAPRFFVTD